MGRQLSWIAIIYLLTSSAWAIIGPNFIWSKKTTWKSRLESKAHELVISSALATDFQIFHISWNLACLKKQIYRNIGRVLVVLTISTKRLGWFGWSSQSNQTNQKLANRTRKNPTTQKRLVPIEHDLRNIIKVSVWYKLKMTWGKSVLNHLINYHRVLTVREGAH